MLNWISNNTDIIIAFTAILAIIISFSSTIFALITFLMQRNHNRKQVRPIANISISDYENELTVKIYNKGIGPLLITNFIVEKKDINEKNIIDLMPELPEGIYWETFSDNLKGFAILPSESINIIDFSLNPENTNEIECRDKIRKELSKIIVKVEYTDIYNRKMPIKEKSLEWFGRHF